MGDEGIERFETHVKGIIKGRGLIGRFMLGGKFPFGISPDDIIDDLLNMSYADFADMTKKSQDAKPQVAISGEDAKALATDVKQSVQAAQKGRAGPTTMSKANLGAQLKKAGIADQQIQNALADIPVGTRIVA